MQDKKPDVPVSDDSNLVIVTTPEYVKKAIEEHAQSRRHPNATLQDKGFVVLSNDVGSDSETMAATPKAVKIAYDLASAANSNANSANNIANNANNNASTRLAKDQNGEDIPDKSAFVKNIGLGNAAIQHQFPNFASVMVTGSKWRNFLIRHDSGLDVNFGSQGESGYIILQPLNQETGKRDTSSSFIFPKGVDGNVLALGYKDHGNVIIGPDGNLRPKSAFIQIYSSGTFATNTQSEGAIAERLSKGTYLIKGVKGFSNDSAVDSIDIPNCQNKLPLIWVNHEILPDGSIKLMTYHREHSDAPIFARNTREGYANGDLIDIPTDRFISVRVQMPDTQESQS
ncbi:phage tail protein [Xenorhabdus bovienii]|uniref:phage tail protein n=1 Tax=Xenorhabdus bovienii TaxID=40576 RepID=UPI0023B35105|nr:phage tail protein [Xenorhabdus bovienii]